MVDNNLSAPAAEPDVTTPMTYDEQVEDLSNLLGDPETDLPEDDQDEAAAAPEATEETDPLFDDEPAEDVDTENDEDPDAETDGPDDAEVKGGRFAPDSAKVKLDNGETITIADLKVRVEKRVKDFQRDHTQKAQSLAAEKAEVDQYAQSLNQSREYLAWYAEQFLPQEPKPFTGDAVRDPVAYMQWQQQRDAWAVHQQAYQAFQQQKIEDDQRKSGETQKQAQARIKREQEALFKAIPVLKDPVKGQEAWNTLVRGATEHYGFPAAEVNGMTDHRFALVLRDAIAYRRIKAKAPQVQEKVAQKAPVRPGKRAAPDAREVQGKQVRSERLRNSGRFEDGVAALQDFDL